MLSTFIMSIFSIVLLHVRKMRYRVVPYPEQGHIIKRR